MRRASRTSAWRVCWPAHEHAFAHFGGRCAELLYERMRTVVLGTAQGKPRWHPTFEAFARHWGFEPRLCKSYQAQTKGKVESGVTSVNRNFLPGRVFRDLDDFNAQLERWQREAADQRIHGTPPPAAHRALCPEGIRSGTYRGPSELPSGHGAPPRGGRGLAGGDRRQPLRGAGRLAPVERASGTRTGAAARNARQRDDELSVASRRPALAEAVEVRDLTVYEQMLEVAR